MADKTRTGWTTVAFGDVVRKTNDQVDPDTSGLERYVAGEHMDSNELKIQRWGTIGDGYLGPAFHMRFRPGQVLYGSRRTYLRKVAVADFEGICANTTFVLETADPDLLLPEFLPYLMQTESFHEYSGLNSKGSVNPYINFSDLAQYEFKLPSLESQREAVQILDSSRVLTETLEDLCLRNEQLVESVTVAAISGQLSSEPKKAPNDWTHGRLVGVDLIPSNWQVARLVDLSSLESGHTPSTRHQEYWDGDVPWVSLHDSKRLDVPTLLTTTKSITKAGLENSSARLLPPKTVVVSRTATVGLTTVLGTEMATSQDFACFICDDDQLLHRYLYYIFRSMKTYLRQVAGGSTHKTVYMPFFEKLEILLPPVQEQKHLSDLVATCEQGLVSCRDRRDQVRTAHMSLVENLCAELVV